MKKFILFFAVLVSFIEISYGDVRSWVNMYTSGNVNLHNLALLQARDVYMGMMQMGSYTNTLKLNNMKPSQFANKMMAEYHHNLKRMNYVYQEKFKESYLSILVMDTVVDFHEYSMYKIKFTSVK